ncbi:MULTISPECIES: MlaD family protein [unclassified Wenzhouxiangella]|uniref:MlaD family protein n=1 Tax=unclassified Wenzhouxiangella TaxID=2613841 RepID=UPI000E325631|nr:MULTISPECIES: MlaD family protein [unclassified Wenzhouxiangella]RFF28416.1 MCE family protein [Wenzhouxiangella sp. 15181]RFP69933.1 MCE family protein [Wenzhouxiangella sp. 15190]
MEPRANHVLIGAFTLAGAILLVLGGLWSAKWASDEAWREVEVHFLQPVSGLNVGSTVQYNGISMGSVRDLRLSPDDPGRVIAVIRIESQVPLREDTTARLSVSGLTGVSTIQLRGGTSDSPVLEAEPGRERPIIIAEESSLQRLIETSEDIASTASEVMLRLLDFLNEENAQRVNTTLNNIDAFVNTLNGEGERVGEIVQNLHRGSEELLPLLEEFRATVAEISVSLERLEPALVETLPQAADQLRDTMEQLSVTAERIDRMVARNEAAVGGFGDQVITPLGPAVQEFRQLIDELSAMTEKFERSPAGFLLGDERPEEYDPK